MAVQHHFLRLGSAGGRKGGHQRLVTEFFYRVLLLASSASWSYRPPEPPFTVAVRKPLDLLRTRSPIAARDNPSSPREIDQFQSKSDQKNVEVLATFNTDLIASGRPRDDAAAAFCVSPRGPDFAEIAVFFFGFLFIFWWSFLFGVTGFLSEGLRWAGNGESWPNEWRVTEPPSLTGHHYVAS